MVDQVVVRVVELLRAKRRGAGLSARRTLSAPRSPAVLVPALTMLALALWGIDRGGMWRDEGVTFQVARRSLPEIWHLLHTVDAVHGVYYLAMHAVLAVHPDEVVLRLPSALAASVAAGLVGALGTHLARPRVGLWAGLLYAVTPMTGHYAQEGRSYALVAAGALAATLLLVRAVRTGTVRAWLWYAAVLGGTVLLHELAVLLLCAHAVTLLLARVAGDRWRGWGCAAAGVCVAALPLVLVSREQSAQLSWLRPPDWGDALTLLGDFTGPAPLVVAVELVLAALAVSGAAAWRARGGRSDRWGRPGRPTLVAVAAPLLVVPPATLLSISQVWPLYDARYVLFSLAGAPLLAAAGAERLAGAVRGFRPPGQVPHRAAGALLGAAVVGLAFWWQVPLLRADRLAAERPDDPAAVAAMAAGALRAGDAVLYVPSIGRRTELAYPDGFLGTRDLALRSGAAASGTLYGREVGPAELRRRMAPLTRVWVLTESYANRRSWHPPTPTERAKRDVLSRDFTVTAERRGYGVVLRLYTRTTPT
ncbi:glycosyltransferase family 39 protein [Streptomyces sp. NPDC091292]|uniref:glycosyltransferase family 39 protein n=1 Tax=Streptomyces sp. NPDC091292 TaxID=3365991 RepID=UPI00382C9036